MIPRQHYSGLIEQYRGRLPITDGARIITLLEGNTPLIRLCNIPKKLGKDVEIYVKYEGLNPTGSFKDRGMTMAVTMAVDQGAQAIICSSTGNTSAAAAAYAARAGITAFVLIPEGKIARGKLAQAMIAGAIVIQVAGNFDDGLRLVKQVAGEAPVTIVNSINPFRLQGQKTIAFEIIEELQRAPDYHCVPVGNAGNISAHWIGYSEYACSSGDYVTGACTLCDGNCKFVRESITATRPIMVGYQASGAAPFIKGEMLDDPETVATAIRIGHPQAWDQALTTQRESGGWFNDCSDKEILAAQKLLAETEGIFCEPASAVSLAGAMKDIASGKIAGNSTIVCTLTGHGLKDPDTAIQQSVAEVIKVGLDSDQVKKAILDNME